MFGMLSVFLIDFTFIVIIITILVLTEDRGNGISFFNVRKCMRNDNKTILNLES